MFCGLFIEYLYKAFKKFCLIKKKFKNFLNNKNDHNK